MPTQRERDLILQRERLLSRSDSLRKRLILEANTLRGPFALVDRVGEGCLWLRRHPEWPVGMLALAFVVRPRRVVRWGARLLWAWQLWRRAQPTLMAVFESRQS